MTEQHLTITNITCEACVKVCTMLLSRVSGVASVKIDQATGETILQVQHPLNLDLLKASLAEKGYDLAIPQTL